MQIRMVLANSTVFTLAGGLVGAGSSSGGAESCPSPCLRGVAGHIDGNLTEARQEMTRATARVHTYLLSNLLKAPFLA